MRATYKCVLTGVLFLLVAERAAATENPVNEDGPYKNRTFAYDTNIYDVKAPLGKFYLYDKSTNTISGPVQTAMVSPRCTLKSALAGIDTPSMQATMAYSFTSDKSYKGSLSFFVANAGLSEDQRVQVGLADIQQANLPIQCELKNEEVYNAAIKIHGAAGKSIMWIFGTILSNLTKEEYEKQEQNVGISAGSWLSVGGSHFKGSDRSQNLPVVSVHGYAVDVPGPHDRRLAMPNVRRFESLTDLGLRPMGLTINEGKLITP